MTETAALDTLKCCKCSRTIAKISPGLALRSGEMIEIKCSSCNGMNYLAGTATDAETDRNQPKA